MEYRFDEFGNELPREPKSVSELNDYIHEMFEASSVLSDVYVRGEISNFKRQSSGHFYFTLKDETSVIKAVMFRSAAYRVRFQPESGMKVLVQGRVSTYLRDGVYQIYVDAMEPDGIGGLYLAYEQLKGKLEAEGLFDPAGKPELPEIPEAVGIITSPTGAAVRDMIRVAGRRFPNAKLLIYPAAVQGSGAADELRHGVEYFNTAKSVDIILLGRGGGSIEDLWAFNDENLARAVASSKIPVISAVGHETDFTICDFVASKRAATPSMAAEIALPDRAELSDRIERLSRSMTRAVMAQIAENREKVERYGKSRALASPIYQIEEKRMRLMKAEEELRRAVNRRASDKRSELSALCGRLNALNPLSVLSRGYAAVFSEDGRVLRSVEQMNPGDALRLTLSDGTVRAGVIDIIRRES